MIIGSTDDTIISLTDVVPRIISVTDSSPYVNWFDRLWSLG